MADIKALLVSDDNEEYIYDVEVDESGSSTTHRVTLSFDDYENMTSSDIEPEELIKRSFDFLLERESKESIKSEFNLKEIADLFPEYEEEVLNI